MKTSTYFFLAAFIVGAALWKGGAPAMPIVAGIGIAGLWTAFIR